MLGGGGIAFWGENIKEVLERMKKEPWVCKPWRPLPAPLGRGCYAGTGWDGMGVGRSRLESGVLPPKSHVGLEEASKGQ